MGGRGSSGGAGGTGGGGAGIKLPKILGSEKQINFEAKIIRSVLIEHCRSAYFKSLRMLL